MPKLRFAIVCFLFVLLQGAGCSGTTQIQTAPPEPAVPAGEEEGEAERRAPLTVVVERGASALPEAVQALRFRIAEVQLKPEDGPWVMYPADPHLFEVTAGQPVRRTVLSSQVPPAAYDSLGLVLSDVYVQFDANAGSPLTMPREAPLTMDIDLQPRAGHPATLRLTFEPGASLSRADDCRWFFLPFVTPTVE